MPCAQNPVLLNLTKGPTMNTKGDLVMRYDSDDHQFNPLTHNHEVR